MFWQLFLKNFSGLLGYLGLSVFITATYSTEKSLARSRLFGAVLQSWGFPGRLARVGTGNLRVCAEEHGFGFRGGEGGG